MLRLKIGFNCSWNNFNVHFINYLTNLQTDFDSYRPTQLQLLTFSYDVQHHSKWGKSSDHVEEGHCVLNGQTLFSCPIVETTDQQWHEEGLEAMDQ